MSERAVERVHWTTEDLDLLPDDGTRYEIIDGELFMSRTTDPEHQWVSYCIAYELNEWSKAGNLGRAYINQGIVFSFADNVIPDILWISTERRAALRKLGRKFTQAPELVVEVLSPGPQNELRDRQAKLKLYDITGVQEYWIADWQLQQLIIYRREEGRLRLAATLLADDIVTSPLLPGFACPVRRLVPEEDE